MSPRSLMPWANVSADPGTLMVRNCPPCSRNPRSWPVELMYQPTMALLLLMPLATVSCALGTLMAAYRNEVCAEAASAKRRQMKMMNSGLLILLIADGCRLIAVLLTDMRLPSRTRRFHQLQGVRVIVQSRC